MNPAADKDQRAEENEIAYSVGKISQKLGVPAAPYPEDDRVHDHEDHTQPQQADAP